MYDIDISKQQLAYIDPSFFFQVDDIFVEILSNLSPDNSLNLEKELQKEHFLHIAALS